jgi:hypothetical protein
VFVGKAMYVPSNWGNGLDHLMKVEREKRDFANADVHMCVGRVNGVSRFASESWICWTREWTSLR